MTQLATIVESIRERFTTINSLRDDTLQRSRMLVRSCAHSIRAIHRHDWDEAESLLEQARGEAEAMSRPIEEYPVLFHAGYTQDSLKELLEAHIVYAEVKGKPIPTPDELNVPGPAYLKGLSEAGTEMRRFVLDLMRRGQVNDAEPYLAFMDEVYSFF